MVHKIPSTIRRLSSADLAAVLVINQANVPAVGTIDTDRLRLIVNACEIALVVEVESVGAGREIAGFCLVLGQGAAYDSPNYAWFMERYTDAYYLDRVAFDARFQAKGLGTALYNEVDRRVEERRAEGQVIERLTLEVNLEPPNVPSQMFHRQRQFSEVGRQSTPYGTVVSLMQKCYGSA